MTLKWTPELVEKASTLISRYKSLGNELATYQESMNKVQFLTDHMAAVKMELDEMGVDLDY